MTRSQFGEAVRCWQKIHQCRKNTSSDPTLRVRKKWYREGCRWMDKLNRLMNDNMSPAYSWQVLAQSTREKRILIEGFYSTVSSSSELPTTEWKGETA